jgi:hypothetical protein
MAMRQIGVAVNYKSEGCCCDSYDDGWLMIAVDVVSEVIWSVRIFEVEKTSSAIAYRLVSENEQIRI